jgi:RecJ-like exonuclease
MTTTEKLSPQMFERTTCWKCDGTGHINAFSHVHGGSCFACNGTGGRLTARGQRQRDAYDAAIVMDRDDIVIGQRVNFGGFIGKVTVISIEHHADGRTTFRGEKPRGDIASYTTAPNETGTVRRVLAREDLNSLITRCLAID